MKNFKSRIISLSGALLYTLMAGQPVMADDTEVLIGTGGTPWSTPNVLFIMDTSGSMARDVNGNEPPAAGQLSRLAIVQNVFRDLMNSNSGFNVGLMRFDGSSSSRGGYFVTPMQELNSNTRDSIIAASNAFTAGSNTPLSETLYEATRFYRGMTVDFGDSTSPGTNHPDVTDGNRYISPITSQCQKNYVIMLTDGEPVSDNDANRSIQALTGNNCSGNCLDEVAGFLHTTDQNNDIPGTQTVETYTIGFTTDQALLQSTADNGGGDYIVADSAEELSSAFTSILEAIAGTNDTFSPPALAANAFNNISHYNKFYFTLFEPKGSAKWDGNVKPYTLTGNPPEITDANGNVAVDNRGYFLESSRSFWSNSADGGSVVDGGANGRLPTASSRNLYTFTGTYNANGIPSLSLLSDSKNALVNDPSSDLDPTMLGLTNPDLTARQAEFDSIINTTRSSTLSDPLHSRPALINYGGTEENPDLTIYVATNAGFLHAIDASTSLALDANSGREHFAFIPQELLPNLATLARGTGNHPYGLDGDVTAWVNDINGDGDVSDTGEHAYIYVGMRRGGNNYYALDVTNRNAPQLKWMIKGGPDGMADFTELGQSWSRPEVTTIKYGDSTRTVLIFGGGYDVAQDSNPVNQPDTIGRAIFIVDAETGERLWWASSVSGANLQISEMTNSIPSNIRLMDSNGDGHTDRLYVGDMDGKIFRVDLQAAPSGVSGSGVLLADLGSTNDTDAANNRRFYYPPDVVVTQQPGVPTYVSVNIGSGYRAHPLNPIGNNAVRVNDRFYSIRDPYVIGEVPDSFTSAIRNSDLFDATTDMVNTEASINNLANSDGWYITLGNGNGEKVLASSITLNGEIFFTTYTPPAFVESSDCAPPPGEGRLYRVSLFNAAPSLTDVAVDADGNVQEPTEEDRAIVLDRPGIPSEPTVMFRRVTDENGNESVELIHCEGTECEQLPDAIRMEETYWRDDA